MSEKQELSPSERWARIQYYQQLTAIQFRLYLAYASIFVTLEGVGLSLAVFLKEFDKTEHLRIIAIIAIVIGAAFLLVWYNIAIQLDRWKSKILELTRGTDMEETIGHWKGWPYQWYEKRIKVMRLLWMVPVFVLLVWVWCYIAF